MTLSVEISIVGTDEEGRPTKRLIGGALVHNLSNLADVSDYQAMVVEQGSQETGLGDFRQDGLVIKDHKRRQSVWELVRKVADRAVDLRRREASGEIR